MPGITGSKPRASGDDPRARNALRRQYRVNPARAGMIPPRRLPPLSGGGKPRASGDDPPIDPVSPDAWVVNPARAGMIHKTRLSDPPYKCKPRASGDDPSAVKADQQQAL